MNSLARVVLKKSAGLHLRRAGLEALPRAASSAPCNVPSMYVSKRYNSSVQNGDKVVEAAANAVDSTGILEQAASIVANNAAEVAVAAEHSNFVIRNVMGLIENVHNFVGIPYWEAIAVTTLGIRFLLIPVVVKTTQSTARLSHLRPTLQKISEAMKNDPRASENAVREHYQKEMQAAFLKYKVHPLHAMLWPLAQMPVFLSMFFAVQAMGTYYPGLAEGGAFWFTNLTLADPTYAFPIINALSFLAMIEMGTSDVQMEQSKTFKNVMRGLAVLTLPFTASMPQSTFIFWTTNNMFSLVQGFAMKNPGVKKFFDIPDMLTTNTPNLKIANPVEKLQEYLADKKDNEANAKAEILDGVSKTKAPSSNSPPPIFYDTPAHKRKEKK